MNNPEKETAANADDIAADKEVLPSNQTQGDSVSAVALVSKTVEELLKMNIPPREYLLSPVLQMQGINMMFAWRGVGKTLVALNMACAVASGGKFHTWKAPRPKKVLYIDGEMPASEMQKRLKEILASGKYDGAEKNIRLINADLNFPHGLPNFAKPEGQRMLDKEVEDADLIVFDNISTLTSGLKENEAESWEPLQSWASKLRGMGKTVLFIHHASKSGSQRGTSKKEDIMDTVIKLQRPPDYDPKEGARFDIIFEKSRNITGSDAEGFSASLTSTGWNFKSLGNQRLEAIKELMNQNLSIREIADELSLSKTVVGRLIQKNKNDSP